MKIKFSILFNTLFPFSSTQPIFLLLFEPFYLPAFTFFASHILKSTAFFYLFLCPPPPLSLSLSLSLSTSLCLQFYLPFSIFPIHTFQFSKNKLSLFDILTILILPQIFFSPSSSLYLSRFLSLTYTRTQTHSISACVSFSVCLSMDHFIDLSIYLHIYFSVSLSSSVYLFEYLLIQSIQSQSHIKELSAQLHTFFR